MLLSRSSKKYMRPLVSSDIWDSAVEYKFEIVHLHWITAIEAAKKQSIFEPWHLAPSPNQFTNGTIKRLIGETYVKSEWHVGLHVGSNGIKQKEHSSWSTWIMTWLPS